MNDEERRRTMDFILEQQAQFTADIQELRKGDEQAERRMARLERVVKLVIRAGVRERRDFRERYNALLDAQIKNEEMTRHNSDDIRSITDDWRERYNALLDAQIKNEETTRLNSENIRSLTENIGALTKRVARFPDPRKGDAIEN